MVRSRGQRRRNVEGARALHEPGDLARRSGDGRQLAFTSREPTSGWDIWTVSLPGRNARRLVATAFNDIEPQFSPDGRWLAYSSDETGKWEVYLRPVGPRRPLQLCRRVGRQAVPHERRRPQCRVAAVRRRGRGVHGGGHGRTVTCRSRAHADPCRRTATRCARRSRSRCRQGPGRGSPVLPTPASAAAE